MGRKRKDLLDRHVKTLGLSPEILRVLRYCKGTIVWQLTYKSEKQLMGRKGMTKEMLREIKNALNAVGLRLNMVPPSTYDEDGDQIL